MAAPESIVTATDEDLVVLVHGTYAASEADEGDGWWQRGSAGWQGLRARLREGGAAVVAFSGGTDSARQILAARRSAISAWRGMASMWPVSGFTHRECDRPSRFR